MIYITESKINCIAPRSFLTFLCLAGFFLFFINSPVQAASIDLPKTGQTLCYDTLGDIISCLGTGQDGDRLAGAAWPSPRFTTDVSLQCITDNLTGLTWARDFSALGGTWPNVVTSLPTTFFACGLDGWRIPNINELQSLINAGQADNALWLALQGFNFPISTELPYWTSTSSADNPTVNSWVVDMAGGSVFPDNKGITYFVWPVRGTSNPSLPADIPPGQIAETGQIKKYVVYDDAYFATTPGLNVGVPWPDPRFVQTGACVKDTLTGLVWATNANRALTSQTWEAALDYVNSLTLCGSSDWRLPNAKELFSLVDRSQQQSALPQNHPFTNVQNSAYWSSTSNAALPENAWVLDMATGSLVFGDKTNRNFLWPVRSGDVKSSKLVVEKNGNGKGIISGDGLTCESGICRGKYSIGEVVTVTAEAKPGSVFDGWTGCGSASDTTCTVIMTTDVTVSAKFLREFKITVEPTFLKFMNLTKGVTSKPKIVTVRNAGAADLLISAIDISGSDAAVFSQVNDCHTEFAHNETCTITVTATSDDFVKKIATLAITSNDPDRSTVDVSLKARAKPPVISVSPNPVDFGGVILSNAKEKTLKITNTGVNNLEITAPISITGGDASDFLINPDTCLPIPAGKNCKLTVTFAPSSLGTRTATVNINSNDPNKTLKTITLKGKGK